MSISTTNLLAANVQMSGKLMQAYANMEDG